MQISKMHDVKIFIGIRNFTIYFKRSKNKKKRVEYIINI